MSTETPDAESPFQLSRTHLAKSLEASPIYGFTMTGGRVLESTTKGVSVTELVLDDRHVNSKGSIHGSVSATIVDWSSGNALASMGSHSGVSTDMHVTFLGKASKGDKILIEGKVDRLGRNLAFTRVEIRNSRTDALVATAIHTKFVG